jgi:hypothetical protein
MVLYVKALAFSSIERSHENFRRFLGKVTPR